MAILLNGATTSSGGVNSNLSLLQLKDTPASYTDAGGKVLAVKADLSGVEFVTIETSSVGISDNATKNMIDITDEQITVRGSIIPDVDNVYNLGAPDKRWHDIFVSANTIYLGDSTQLSGTSIVVDAGENPTSLADMPTVKASRIVAVPFSYNPGGGSISVRPSIEFQVNGQSYPISFNTETLEFSLDAAGNHGTGSLVAKKITLRNDGLTSLDIQGNFIHDGNYTNTQVDKTFRFDGNLTLGYDATKILTVKASTNFEGPVSFKGSTIFGDGNDPINLNAGTNTFTVTSGNFNVNAAGDTTISGNLAVQGNLTVSGATTIINSNEVNIGDNIITLNSDIPGGMDPTENAGIQIARGTEAASKWLWVEAQDYWSPMGADIKNVGTLAATTVNATNLTGTLTGNVVGDVTGSVTGSVSGNAGSASKLETARQISLIGDVTGSAMFDGSSNITIDVDISSAGATTSDKRFYVATEGQTTFAATYHVGHVDVYVNGVRMVDGDDFTATNGTSVTLTTPAKANDIIQIVGWSVFTIADSLTQANADSRYAKLTGADFTGKVTIAGDVGISRTPTNFRFEVQGDGPTSNGIGVADSGGALRCYLVGNGTRSAIGTTNALPLVFETATVERVRIDGSGNMGIGTATPVGKLGVNGAIHIATGFGVGSGNGYMGNTTAAGNAALTLWDESGHTVLSNSWGSGAIVLKTFDTERIRVTGSGNVGIGTSSPSHGLDVVANSALAKFSTNQSNQSERAGMFINAVGGPTRADRHVDLLLDPNGADGVGIDYAYLRRLGTGELRIVNAGGNPTTFWTNDSERLRINADGRIGVGTNNPTAAFEISNPTYGFQLRLHRSGSGAGRGTGYLSLASDDSLGNVTEYAGVYGVIENSADGAESGALAVSLMSNGTLVERFRIDSSGNILAGVVSYPSHKIAKNVAEGIAIMTVGSPTADMMGFYHSTGVNWNTAGSAMRIGRNSSTSRSINAAGTVNASGADYAEYIKKSDTCGIIEKGDIAGINANGQLTDKFDEAHSFVVKSTDPAYVGGDIWGTEEVIGAQPVNPGDNTDEQLKSQYATELAAWESRLEAERVKYDRIAFAGQVPVNVSGQYAVGDYIVAERREDGGITAIAVTNPTFEQYRSAVGKVWAVRGSQAWVAVKIG